VRPDARETTVDTPLVSISIPSYNHARWLPQAIDSVLAQTYENIELVIVDDGSTDESLGIAEGYAGRHPDKIRVFTHDRGENRGISATCNRAIAECRGKYWAGLPSDDLILPNKIESQLAILEARPNDAFVWGQSQAIDEDGRPLSEHGPLGRGLPQRGRALDLLLRENPIYGQTPLVRRSALDQLADDVFPVDVVAQDWYLWIRLVARFSATYVPEVVAKFRVHPASTSWSARREDHVRWHLQVLERVRSEAATIGGGLRRTRTLGFLHMQIALNHFALGEPDAAQSSIREALGVLKGKPLAASAVLASYCLAPQTVGEDAAFADFLLTKLGKPLNDLVSSRHVRGLALARAAVLARHEGTRKNGLGGALAALAAYPLLLRERSLAGAIKHGLYAGRKPTSARGSANPPTDDAERV